MPKKNYLKYIIGIICLTIAGCIVWYYLQPSTPHKNNNHPTKKVSETPSQESKKVKVQGTNAIQWFMPQTLEEKIIASIGFLGVILVGILLYYKAPDILLALILGTLAAVSSFFIMHWWEKRELGNKKP